MVAYDFTTAVVPRHCHDTGLWNELVLRQKGFRLKSLQLDPAAFGSTFELEQQNPLETWGNRLKNPKVITLVALDGPAVEVHSETSDPDAAAAEILRHEWLGSVRLVGVEKEDEAHLLATGSPWGSEARKDEGQKEAFGSDAVPRYHLSGMFVVPAARGRGIGKKLIEDAISHSSRTGRVRYTIMVDADNIPATTLYSKLGFQILDEWEYERIKTSGQTQPIMKVCRYMDFFAGA